MIRAQWVDSTVGHCSACLRYTLPTGEAVGHTHEVCNIRLGESKGVVIRLCAFCVLELKEAVRSATGRRMKRGD